MLLPLVLLFIVVPIVEIYVIIQVGHAIGALDTIALLVLVSLVGAWLTRHEGFVVLRRLRAQIDEFVSELDDVEEVSSSMVFAPPWTPEKMSEDAKFALGY